MGTEFTDIFVKASSSELFYIPLATGVYFAFKNLFLYIYPVLCTGPEPLPVPPTGMWEFPVHHTCTWPWRNQTSRRKHEGQCANLKPRQLLPKIILPVRGQCSELSPPCFSLTVNELPLDTAVWIIIKKSWDLAGYNPGGRLLYCTLDSEDQLDLQPLELKKHFQVESC